MLAVLSQFSLPTFGQGARIVESPKPDFAEGEKLRAELLAVTPANSSVRGVLKFRDREGSRREVAVRLTTLVLSNGVWEAGYQARGAQPEQLTVRHSPNSPNDYFVADSSGARVKLARAKIFAPFAGSDFSPADLGLDFLQWPKQAIVGGGLQNGRPYKLLESTTTNAPAGGYARVRSRVDKDTGGIVHAEAFDAKGRAVKEFSLSGFKQVDGVWQLREMKMVDQRADSITRLEFELDVKATE